MFKVLKIGDKVRVIPPEESGGNQDHWVDEMYSFIGKIGTIEDICSSQNSLTVRFEKDYLNSSGNTLWSYFGFEIEAVESEPMTKEKAPSSHWNTTCSKCGSPAYQGFLKLECSSCKE